MHYAIQQRHSTWWARHSLKSDRLKSN